MMGKCLYCFHDLDIRLSWRRLFFLEKEPVLCDECSKKLEPISGCTCPLCGRPNERSEWCADCHQWEKHPDFQGVLKRNRSVFRYNDFMKEVLTRFKFRGDAILAEMFRESFLKAFQVRSYESYLLLPIPLSKERLLERGFNQAKLLAELLPLPIIEPLRKRDSTKQSKKPRKDRIVSRNLFTLMDPKLVVDQNIMIIDDIYTTGATVRQAAEILLRAGAKTVESFTLVRS